MEAKEIFELALGLQGTPWKVVDVQLDTKVKPGRLDLYLDFPPGSQFPHPQTQQLCPVYDRKERTWRHLNFFQYECYLHARVPRVNGGGQAGIKQVPVPWGQEGSGFTLLMEAMMVLLAQSGMTVAEAARTLGENDHRLWRVLHDQVRQAHQEIELQGVEQISVDETSLRKGHEYATIVCEPADKERGRATRVLFVTEGKDAQTVHQAGEFFRQRGISLEQIREICADMSPSYAKGIEDTFPTSRLVFDYFHVIGLITDAVDKVRRRESKQFPELLKGTRYLWFHHEENLDEERREQRLQLCRSKLKTAKAHCHLAAFQDLLKASESGEAIRGLKWWYYWVTHSRIPEMIDVAKKIKNHWDGLVAYLETRLTNGPMEAINGIIQTAKRKARGFRNFENFQTIIYLIGSKLSFNLPSPIPADPHKTS